MTADAPSSLDPPQALPNGMLPCFRCGYDLRGSALAGTCPECGTPYHRHQLYLDVARQRLRDVSDDIQFVWFGSLGIVACSLGRRITAVVVDHLDPLDWITPLSGLTLLIAFAYLILLAAYGSCWFRLLWEIHYRRILWWSQVTAVGLHRPLVKSGIALTVALVVALV